jgi:endonuclease III
MIGPTPALPGRSDVTNTECWLSPIVEELRHFYEPQPEAPRDAFVFYLWYVLGQRTTPARRDAAMAALKRIPALTPDAVWKAPRAKLQAAIAHVGPPEERLHAVIAGVEVFRRYREIERAVRGPILQARRSTRLLRVLGPVGAQWMLLAAGDHPILPRHAGVGRIAMRLGVVPPPCCDGARAPWRAARVVAATVPRDVRFLKPAILYLSHHAAATCTVAEPHCRVCPLAVDCAYAHAPVVS